MATEIQPSSPTSGISPQRLPAQFAPAHPTTTTQGELGQQLFPQPGVLIPYPKTKAIPNQALQMRAVVWRDRKILELGTLAAPAITEPDDAIIRITTSAICGSDLSLYRAEVPGLSSGEVLGHEAVGIVYQVGSNVKTLRVGDRVVIASTLACGQCFQCLQQNYACCDSTNPTMKLEEEFGQKGAGVFGLSQVKGGYDGLQAEYARVPFADWNCLKVTGTPLTDERLIWLSDVLPTAWYANELAEVRLGSSVAIWGAGPVGLATALVAKQRGASIIVCIDYLAYRLTKATQIGATYTIDPTRERVLARLKEICPRGFDACIDCAGFRVLDQLKHKMKRFLEMEVGGANNVLIEAVMAARKGGFVVVIGDYLQYKINGFPIAAIIEKGLQLRAGHTPVQKYWASLLNKLETNQLDPYTLVSHSIPLANAPAAYVMAEKKHDKVLKVLLRNQSQA